uniref:Uncharacterized protein n=1 Tax=Cacopsylla melanoneura TaxID=428564 RepID=A0A8D8Q9L7_9HEMI
MRIKPTPKGTPNSHEKVEHETEFKDNLIPKNMMSHVPKSLPIITSTPTVISSTDIFLNNISRSFEPKFKPLPPQDEASIDIFDLFNNLGEPNFMKNPQKMDITNVNTTSSDTKFNVIETITLSTATTPLPITTIPTTVSITSTTTNMTKPRLVRGRGSLKTNKIDGNSTDTTTSIKSRRPVKITSKNETFESGAKVESSENSNDSAFDTRQHKRKYPRPARKHYGSDQDKSESSLSFENSKTSNKMVHKDSYDFRPSRTFTRESTTNNPVTTGPEPAANRVTVKPIQSIERVKIKNQIKEKLENSTKRYQANLSKIKGLYNHKNNSDLLERRLKNKERLLSRFSSSTVEPSSIESSTESEE